jgi:Raf kinase inhibitor-like YbhB/YbcL family protein
VIILSDLLGDAGALLYSVDMKKRAILAIGLVIVAAAGVTLWWKLMAGEVKQHQVRHGARMKLTSTAFKDGEKIPAQYSCQGEDINPPLEISETTDESQSLALIVDDPDAPGGTYVHWVLWNIPVSTIEIPGNWMPESGVSVGSNGSGKEAWTPPCPPSGTHHYHFKLYALDQKLDLAAGSDKAELESAMNGHIVGQAELVGMYAKH